MDELAALKLRYQALDQVFTNTLRENVELRTQLLMQAQSQQAPVSYIAPKSQPDNCDIIYPEKTEE